jgi:hypothetical protein
MGFGINEGKKRVAIVLRKLNIFPQAIWNGDQANFPDAVGLTAVAHDESLTGNGTIGSPLGVIFPDSPVGSMRWANARPTDGKWVSAGAQEGFLDANKLFYYAGGDTQSVYGGAVWAFNKLVIASDYRSIFWGVSSFETIRYGSKRQLEDADGAVLIPRYDTPDFNTRLSVIGDECFAGVYNTDGRYGFLYSPDQGASWEFFAQDDITSIPSGFAKNGNVYVMVTNDGSIYYTETPLGVWMLADDSTFDGLYDVIWSPTLGMFVAGGLGVIGLSSDGINWTTAGEFTWDDGDGDMPDPIVQVIDDGGKVYLLGAYSEKIYTTNDGENFSDIEVGFGYKTQMAVSGNSIAVTAEDTALISIDGGATFNMVGISGEIKSVATDGTYFYFVSAIGTLIIKLPVTGVFAGGVATFTDNPSAGDTITVGNKTYTFVDSGPSETDILIGATLADTLANFDFSDDFGDGDYFTFSNDSTHIYLKADNWGIAYNGIATEVVSAVGSFAEPVTSGGADVETVNTYFCTVHMSEISDTNRLWIKIDN